MINKVIVILIIFLFPLFVNAENKDTTRVMLLWHTYPMFWYPDVIESLRNDINNSNISAVFFMWDFIWEWTEENWNKINNFVKSLNKPYYFVPGNHDISCYGICPNDKSKNRDKYIENIWYTQKVVNIDWYNFILFDSVADLKELEDDFSPNNFQIDFLENSIKWFKWPTYLLTHYNIWDNIHLKNNMNVWENKVKDIIKDKIKYIFAWDNTKYYFEKTSDFNIYNIWLWFKIIAPQYLILEPNKNWTWNVYLKTLEIPTDSEWYTKKVSVSTVSNLYWAWNWRRFLLLFLVIINIITFYKYIKFRKKYKKNNTENY